MIKPSEIRIGNIIQCQLFNDREWRSIAITGIKRSHDNTFISWHINACCPADMVLLRDGYESIPLTPERLMKIGFQEVKKGCLSLQVNNNQAIRIYGSPAMTEIAETFFGNYAIAVRHCEFLHQFQNLFYCLTGEELTVNL